MHKQRLAILIASAIGVIITFLPWLSASSYFIGGNVKINGMRGTGILYFMLMIAILVISIMGNRAEILPKNKKMWVIYSGAAGILCLFIYFAYYVMNSGPVDVSVSSGWVLALLIAAAVTALPFVEEKPGGGFLFNTSIFTGNRNAAPVQQKPSAGGTPAPATSRMDELEKLIKWKNEGMITQEEYEQLKSKIV